MQVLREVAAVIMFVLGVVFIVDLVSNGFDSKGLLFAVLCFVGAYIVWPSKKKVRGMMAIAFLISLNW